MGTATEAHELDLLLAILDQSYDRKAWHGTNLRGSLRGVDAAEASRRPARGRHNIWEVMLHATYWKYTVRRRLLGEERGSFPLKGSNWFVRPDGSGSAGWRQDVALLDEVHTGLRAAIARLDPALLHRRAPASGQPGGSSYTTAALIYGIASHDLYHAGQIQLIKRIIRSR